MNARSENAQCAPAVASDARIGPFVHLPQGLHVESGAEIAAGVAFDAKEGGICSVRVRSFARIGVNASICNGVELGSHCVVQPGAVVTRDVPPNAIVTGNPAHISGYVNTPHLNIPGADPSAGSMATRDRLPQLNVHRARLCTLPKIVDLRGALSFGEIGAHLPFTPQRFFMVYDVPSKEVRGEHAHKACHQFLVCVKGSVGIVVDDGTHRDELLLDSPRLGLHIPPMVWGIQYQFSSDAVLLVLASDCYAADDYIRNYDDFLAAVRGAPHGR